MAVRISGTLATTDPSDVFATHDSAYGLGGYREVADVAARDAITDERRREGMLVYTVAEDTYWRLNPGPWVGSSADWEDPGFGGGALENRQIKTSLVVGPEGDTGYVTDGLADNVQIQAAIDALTADGGGTVRLQAATLYDIDATVQLKPNVNLIGEGWTTILKAKNGLNSYPLRAQYVNLVTNVILKDFKVDLNGPNQTSNGWVALTGLTHFTLDHIWINNSRDFGLLIQPDGDPITGNHAMYGLIINCRFDVQQNIRDFAIINMQHSRVVNNYFGANAVGGHSNYTLSAGRSMRHVLVANNTFRNTNQCSIGFEDVQDVLIMGNVVEGAGHHGIFVTNYTQGVYCERVTIANNIVSGSGTDGIKLAEGLGARGCKIVDNICHSNGRDGISLYGADNCTVSGNTCYNNNQAPYPTPQGSGIRFSGGSPQYCVVIGNACYDDQVVPTQNYGIHAGNGDYYVFANNNTHNNVVAGYSIAGANSLISNNIGQSSFILNSTTVDLENALATWALKIVQTGDTGTVSSAHGALYLNNTGNPGLGLNVYTDNAAATAPLASLRADNTAFIRNVVEINNDGSGRGLLVTQNSPGAAVQINTDADNSVSGATGLFINSNGAHTSAITSRPLFRILNDNASSLAAAIQIQQDGTGNSIELDPNGNVGSSVSTDGALHIVNTENLGIGLGVYSDIDGTVTAPLVHFKHDNVAAVTNVLKVENDGTADAQLISSTGTGKALAISHVDTGTSASLDVLRTGNNAAAVVGLHTGVSNAGAGAAYAAIFETGRVGVNTTAPTARLHLGAGTATASTAPLKLTAGTHLTTPEAGAVEFDGTHLYVTVGSTRYQLDQQSSSGATPVTLTDAATIATNAALGTTFDVTLDHLTATRVLGTPSGPTNGQRIVWRIRQDATGGALLTYSAVFRFGTDVPSATLTTDAAKTDYLAAIYNSADTKWDVVSFVKGY